MAITLQNADNALKTYYLDAVSSQLDGYVNPFFAAIKKTTNDVWGKEVRKLAVSGLNGGIGAGTEDGGLPAASGNNYVQLVSTLKNLYGVIEISDKAIRASENNAGSFVSLLNSEMESLIKASSFNFGRMLYGNGTGFLASIRSIADGMLDVDNLNNLSEGMIVDIVDGQGVPVAGATGRKITNIDRDMSMVTISGEEVIEDNLPSYAYLMLQGSYNNEITGLGAIFDNKITNIYGVNKAQTPILNPYIKHLSGEISEEAIQIALDEIELKSGNKVNFIVCSLGVRRALQKLFSQNKRVVDTMELAGGFKAMSFNGIPIVADRFCPKGTMYLLNTNDFALHQLCDWQWLSGDDGKVLRQVPGKPVYTATLVKYADLICSCPAGQGMIASITE